MGAAPFSPSSYAKSPQALVIRFPRVVPGSPVSYTSLFIFGVSGFSASSADITKDAALDQLEALVAYELQLEPVVWSSTAREKRLVLVVPSRQKGQLVRLCHPG